MVKSPRSIAKTDHRFASGPRVRVRLVSLHHGLCGLSIENFPDAKKGERSACAQGTPPKGVASMDLQGPGPLY